MDVVTTDIDIVCTDNFQLSGTIYTPSKLKGSVLIAPATGIKKRFYNSFAIFLAEHGYGVICYDNRGVGGSIEGSSINSGNPSLVSWGQLDLSAAFKKLKTSFSNIECHIVGHSAGGQLIGLMDDVSDIKSLFNFASSSGSLSNMSYPFKIQATFFLNVFIPISNLVFSKTNSQWMGMGEPLPKNEASQWSKWCNGKGYVAVDFNRNIKDHLYNEITAPSLWMHATDDGIANLENVKDMQRIYPNSKAEIKTLIPSENGFKDIGHMKFFSSKYNKLWQHAIDWLERD